MKKCSTLLAFDTVLNKTFITLFQNGEFTSKIIESDENNYHSVYLISELKKMVSDFSLLDKIAVNIGPGSFTGIRVCLTVANVMAQELNIPIIGVPSTEILSTLGNGQVFLDARRGDYIFYEPENETKLIKKEDALKIVKKDAVCDFNCFEYFRENGIETINYETLKCDLGEILAEIALEKDNEEKQVKPLYLQTPPVFSK